MQTGDTQDVQRQNRQAELVGLLCLTSRDFNKKFDEIYPSLTDGVSGLDKKTVKKAVQTLRRCCFYDKCDGSYVRKQFGYSCASEQTLAALFSTSDLSRAIDRYYDPPYSLPGIVYVLKVYLKRDALVALSGKSYAYGRRKLVELSSYSQQGETQAYTSNLVYKKGQTLAFCIAHLLKGMSPADHNWMSRVLGEPNQEGSGVQALGEIINYQNDSDLLHGGENEPMETLCEILRMHKSSDNTFPFTKANLLFILAPLEIREDRSHRYKPNRYIDLGKPKARRYASCLALLHRGNCLNEETRKLIVDVLDPPGITNTAIAEIDSSARAIANAIVFLYSQHCDYLHTYSKFKEFLKWTRRRALEATQLVHRLLTQPDGSMEHDEKRINTVLAEVENLFDSVLYAPDMLGGLDSHIRRSCKKNYKSPVEQGNVVCDFLVNNDLREALFLKTGCSDYFYVKDGHNQRKLGYVLSSALTREVIDRRKFPFGKEDFGLIIATCRDMTLGHAVRFVKCLIGLSDQEPYSVPAKLRIAIEGVSDLGMRCEAAKAFYELKQKHIDPRQHIDRIVQAAKEGKKKLISETKKIVREVRQPRSTTWCCFFGKRNACGHAVGVGNSQSPSVSVL